MDPFATNAAPMSEQRALHVTLVATPDAQVSPLSGLYETLGSFELLSQFEPDLPSRPFAVEIVAPGQSSERGASGLPLGARRACTEVARTDIAIVPLMAVASREWERGRYPAVVEWLRCMHADGAMLCSACTGVLLLAETGLLDGREATIHWAFASTFRRAHPAVHLRPREALVVTGDRQELVMSGGVMSWHDLALYLIARHVGPSAAQAVARFFMLQWHGEGQGPYVAFMPQLEHGDALVRDLQEWLGEHATTKDPVAAMVRRSGLGRRSLERRFRRATGRTPAAYVQALRVAEARRRLERTSDPVESIAFDVGYANTAFFRRIFKRATRLTPGAYRRRFQVPEMPSPEGRGDHPP